MSVILKNRIPMVMLLVSTMVLMGWVATNLFALDRADKEVVVEGNNIFAFDLYAQLKAKDGNLFFSPCSISTALAMTYAGAWANTAAQMADVLHFELAQERLHPAFLELMQDLAAEPETSGYQLAIANALWAQSGYALHKKFIDITMVYYDAGFKELDFINDTEGSRQTINSWVEKKTNDKIKELIKPGILNLFTSLVLTNAIYFKGNWLFQFNPEYTQDTEFALIEGEKAEVPMMNQARDFNYFENDLLQVLEMPYSGEELSMIILLPKQTDGLKQVEEMLTKDNVHSWLSALQKQEVIVYLPKFKMTSEFELSEVLKSLGMVDAFSAKADFSGMTPDPVGFYISAVIHKAFVDVNEEGTEAAAATAIVTKALGPTEPKPIFRAEHPFIFLIRDIRVNNILFLGRVMDPRQ